MLDRRDLLNLVVRSIEDSGWNVIVVNDQKPFEVRVFRNESRGFNLRVYIWNCTHGGGAARARDEYRIQFTSVVPKEHGDAVTLLLGWHDGYEVFAAWDIRRHDGQDSSSPSAQIREELLAQAHSRQFAIGTRGNGEIVVAFRPEFLVDYAINAAVLHRTGDISEDFRALNEIDQATVSQVENIQSPERRKVVAKIFRRFRAADFRKRVLGAYSHRCSMCGVQLELIDAAHILPVAADGSTDETNNGIALCRLHHAAYDRNLISFNEEYRVEVSDSEVRRLNQAQRGGGLGEFISALKPAIILPNDRRDYPTADLILLSRQARNWSA